MLEVSFLKSNFKLQPSYPQDTAPEFIEMEFRRVPKTVCGWDSSVGIASRYGLNSPGIESRWGRDFFAPVLGPTQPPVQWVPGFSPGVKPPGRGADPHPHLQCRGLEQGRALPLPTLRTLVACYKKNLYLYPFSISLEVSPWLTTKTTNQIKDLRAAFFFRKSQS